MEALVFLVIGPSRPCVPYFTVPYLITSRVHIGQVYHASKPRDNPAGKKETETTAGRCRHQRSGWTGLTGKLGKLCKGSGRV